MFYVLTLCYFVLVFFSPFSIAITSLGEEKANLGVYRAFVRIVLVWKGLRFVIVALPGLFFYHFYVAWQEITVMLKQKKTNSWTTVRQRLKKVIQSSLNPA